MDPVPAPEITSDNFSGLVTRLGHAAERKVAFDVGGIGRGLYDFRRVKLDQWIFIGVEEIVTLQFAILQPTPRVNARRLYLYVQNTGRRVRGGKNQAGVPFVELSRNWHRRTHGEFYRTRFRRNHENRNRLGFARCRKRHQTDNAAGVVERIARCIFQSGMGSSSAFRNP